MNDKIQIGGLYKIKEGKSLCEIEEYLSPYVRMLGYAKNPLENDNWYIEFFYVYKKSLEPTTRIHPIKILPYDTFLEYFDLDSTTHQVNQMIYELEKNNN